MKKLTTQDFIIKSRLVHGDLYDYSKVDYVNMHTDVEIVCKKHGSFYQNPSNHVRGAGCSICNKIDKRILPKSEFIKRSKKIHGSVYDYSTVHYTNTKTKVSIISYRGLYEKMIYVWTVSDIQKRIVAIQNHLNYLVFWDYDLSDFMNWYDNFDLKRILCNV